MGLLTGAIFFLRKRKFEFSKISPKFFVFLPFFFILLHLCLNAAFRPVAEIDSQMYHLPFAINWLQTQNIYSVFFSAFAGPIGYYPGNHEIFLLWNIFPFNSDGLVNFVNIPIFLMFFLLVWNFGKKLELNIYAKAILVLLLFSSPFFLRQATIPQSDVFQAFFLISSIYYLYISYKEKSTLNIILFAAALSVAMGTKYSGLIYSLPLIFGFHLLMFRKLKFRDHFLVFLTYATVGGYFYLRNFLFTGNPIFPVELSIGDFEVLKGYLGYTEKVTKESIWNFISSENYKSILHNHLDYLGYNAVFLPIAFVLLPFIALKNFIKKRFLNAGVYSFLFFSIAFGIFFYLRAPWSAQATNIRYGAVIFIILWGIYMHFFRHKFFLALTFFMAVLTFTNITLKQDQLFQSADRVWYFLEFNYFKSYGFEDPLIKDAYFKENKMEHTVKMFQWVKDNLPSHSNIAYANFIFPYYLYDENFSREVSYVNVNDCQKCGYYEFSDSPESILEGKNFDSWMANLKNANKEYFVLGFLSDDMSANLPHFFYDWVFEHPGNFQELYSDANGRIYKIIYEID
jgi:hypothetical protein